MPENKLRKKYRDKFRRKFGMKASDLPTFQTAEQYESFYKETLFREELKHFNLGYPDELEIAEERLEEFFNSHVHRIGGIAKEGYEGLARLRRNYYDVEKPKRRRLLENASENAIEAIEKVVKYRPDTEQHQAGLLVLQRILTGGEVLTMDEAYMYVSSPYEEEYDE